MNSKNKKRGKPENQGGIENTEGGFKTAPKKSLGQNFLNSEAAIWKIIQAAKIVPDETVLEIGPGRGALTKALLAAGAKVMAIEKDHELFGELTTKFSEEISAGRLKLVEGDALEIETGGKGLETKTEDEVLETKTFGEGLDLKSGEYKIVANIPYNITGQFLRQSLSGQNPPSQMVLLLQKEVVDRIVAHDKKESLLSISVKVYGQPKKIAVVKSGSFFPAPNVDSAIISIENISKNYFNKISEEKFFEILRAGFAHKRKMLVPNLGQNFEKEKVLKAFEVAEISEKSRAEDLNLEQWQKLVQEIKK